MINVISNSFIPLMFPVIYILHAHQMLINKNTYYHDSVIQTEIILKNDLKKINTYEIFNTSVINAKMCTTKLLHLMAPPGYECEANI